MNVVFDRAGLARKRYGCAGVTPSGLTEINTNGAFWLMGFLPGQTDAGGYLVVSMGNGQFATIAASATEQALTEADINDGNAWDVSGVVINGKAYLAYNSDENRLHVLHPAISTTVLRRSGLETPAAPTVADTGAGTYAATIRRYRVQWRTLVGGAKQRASNLGASVAFTPAGTGTAARVTQPAPPGEGETHWVVYGTASATDENAAWFEVSGEIAIGTTTYDDSAAPSTYDDGEPAPAEGAFTPWPSVKYLATDGVHLLGFGVWETAAGDAMEPLTGLVYVSPALDTTDFDDDERVSNTTEFKGTIEIGRNVGVSDRGIQGPINGEFLVGQSRGVTLLSPTGDATDPYTKRKLSSSIGFLSQNSSFVGEDELGHPCIYFCDPQTGPYRYGANGLEWIGYDVQDQWALRKLTASPAPNGVWYEPLKLAIWWIPQVINAFNTRRALVLHTQLSRRDANGIVHYGWSVWTWPVALPYGAAQFSENIMDGATDEVPALWIATGVAGAPLFLKMGQIDLIGFTASALTSDAGSAFPGRLTSKAYQPFRPSRAKVDECYIDANAEPGVAIEQIVSSNYGEASSVSTRLLTPAGVETRVFRKFENVTLTDADSIQVSLGDETAGTAQWTIHGWIALLSKLQER
jgi:hypothetical protein